MAAAGSARCDLRGVNRRSVGCRFAIGGYANVQVALALAWSASLIALELGTTKVAHVRDILASGRDQLAPVMTTEWTSPEHANVRGAGHYQ